MLRDLDIYQNPQKLKIISLYNEQILALLKIVEKEDSVLYNQFLENERILNLVVKGFPITEYI
jgi:hypothetical protein